VATETQADAARLPRGQPKRQQIQRRRLEACCARTPCLLISWQLRTTGRQDASEMRPPIGRLRRRRSAASGPWPGSSRRDCGLHLPVPVAAGARASAAILQLRARRRAAAHDCGQLPAPLVRRAPAAPVTLGLSTDPGPAPTGPRTSPPLGPDASAHPVPCGDPNARSPKTMLPVGTPGDKSRGRRLRAGDPARGMA
jgi:hypothetical protein